MEQQDYKSRIYKDYYRTHIAPRKAVESVDQLDNKCKAFDMHFGFALPQDHDAQIIDAGCGNGSLVYWLQKNGYRNAMGVDGSLDYLVAGQALGIQNLFVGNLVTYLAERPTSFDVIFLRDVLEHFDKKDVLSTLDICYQALRPGGRIVIQVPNGASPCAGRVIYGDFTHEFAFTQSSVSQLFLLAKFSNITVKSYYPYFPRLSMKLLFKRKGLEVLARRLAWVVVRRLFALMLFAEIGRHSTVVTFNLIAAGTRPLLGESEITELSPLRPFRKDVGSRPADVRDRSAKWIKSIAKWFYFPIVKFQIACLPNSKRLPRAEEIKQIVMLGDMGIGNFIMLTPLLRNLRRAYPEAEIVMLFIKSRSGASMLAERLESVDRVINMPDFQNQRITDAIKFRRALAKYKLSPQIMIIRFSGNRFIPWIAFELRPTWRVGHVSSGGFKNPFDGLFNVPVFMGIEQSEVERNLDLARALGIQVGKQCTEFPVSEAESDKARKALVESNVDSARLICLQMGSSEIQNWKRWPESHWRELLAALYAAGWQLGLVGSESEFEFAAEIASGSGAGVINFCGRFDLGTTGALLRCSRLLICNDSGLMHVAAAVGTPIIGLFGPTDFERTKPLIFNAFLLRGECQCNQDTLLNQSTLERIKKCDRPCLHSITPDQVLEKVKSILN